MADSSVAYTLENVFEINERLPVAPEATDPTDESETKKKNTIESFSQKFLSYFEPDLRKINEKLREVQQNQNVLIESLSQEKEKLAKCAAVNEVETAMVQINHYRMKLCRIKVNMIALKEQSNRCMKQYKLL